MQTDEMLDALLTERAQGLTRHGSPPQSPSAQVSHELKLLLDAAARLDPLRDAAPSADFAADLEERLLARMAPHARSVRVQRTSLTSRITAVTRPHPAWAGIAAALLLTIGLGVFTAQAAPGQPLYTVRQFAQHVASEAFPPHTEDAHAALARASADLAAYHAQIAQGDTAAALTTLTALRADDAQAATAIAAIHDASAQASVQAQLAQFRQRAQVELRASLSALGWQGRASVTDVLRGWGDTTLVVTSARIAPGSGSDQSQRSGASGDTLVVEASGAGFGPGTTLLINGQPVDVVVSVTPTKIVARIPSDALTTDQPVIGVQAADGTVAIAARVERDGASTPGNVATPGSGDHGGSHGGSNGGSATPGEDATPPSSPHG